MRGNELLNKMELIDFAYVEAADIKPPKKGILVKCVAVAACLCVVATGFLLFIHYKNPQLPDTQLNVGGMGFEGYMCYDISELSNGNPWDESMDINSLPVYKNKAYDPSGAGVPKGLNKTEMLERLEFAVSALNLELVSKEIITDGVNETPTEIHAETNNGTIHITANGGIAYFLPDEGLVLSNKLNFTHRNTTNTEAENVLSFFINAYNDFLNFKKPIGVSFGDYNIYGEFNRSYIVYDAYGKDVEDIINYNFRLASFSPNDMGNLFAIRINDDLITAEKLGDYPVITVNEATEQLILGKYQTSVPIKFPGEEFIGRIELVYRTGSLEEVLMPYYRFYVQLTTENQSAIEKGLKTYGTYYVPAIADEYLANMSLYDGNFN